MRFTLTIQSNFSVFAVFSSSASVLFYSVLFAFVGFFVVSICIVYFALFCFVLITERSQTGHNNVTLGQLR